LRPYLEKYPTRKKRGGVVQVVKLLPSKCEALSSPTTTKNKKQRNLRSQRKDSKILRYFSPEIRKPASNF
jgi:hypothetical protein